MCLNFCFHHLNYKLKLLRSFLPGCVKQSVRPLSQAGTYPTHLLRFLILCSFNRELDCDIFPKDNIFFKKLLLLFRCLTSKQCTALKPTASFPTCSPQLTPPGITQVSLRWVRCFFLDRSGTMFFFRSVVCLIW